MSKRAEAPSARERNDTLALFKCLAIYSVVLIHIPLPGRAGAAVNCLARFAVPLFFLSAGFFSWNRGSAVLARRAARTARLLLGTCAGLLALGCVLALSRGEALPRYLLGRLGSLNLRDLLLYHIVPLPYSWPLWFLVALLLAYLVWWGMTALLERLGKPIPYSALLLLALLLLSVHLTLGEGRSLLGAEVNGLLVRNVWLEGLPLFAVGAWMGAHREEIARRTGGWLWIGIGLSCLLALLERRYTAALDLHLGSLLTALLLMAQAIRHPAVNSPLLRATACRCGAELTFYIFVLHVPIYGVLREWQGAVPAFARLLGQQWLLPLWVAALSTLLAILLHRGTAFLRRAKHRGENHETH